MSTKRPWRQLLRELVDKVEVYVICSTLFNIGL